MNLIEIKTAIANYRIGVLTANEALAIIAETLAITQAQVFATDKQTLEEKQKLFDGLFKQFI